jgi:hypothetical protein
MPRKSRLCSPEIICNKMLFTLSIEAFLILSYPRTISLCKPCRIFLDRLAPLG